MDTTCPQPHVDRREFLAAAGWSLSRPNGREARQRYRSNAPYNPASMLKLRKFASHDTVVALVVVDCDPAKLKLAWGPTKNPKFGVGATTNSASSERNQKVVLLPSS